MAFDLRGALLKKQEYECARLDEFLFRHRARTIRLLAEWARQFEASPNAIDPRELASTIVTASDDKILDRIAGLTDANRISRHALDRQFRRAGAQADQELVAELGDPSPHSLA